MVNRFLNYLALERKYSPLTEKNYGKDLQEFEAYFKSLGDQDLSWQTVDADIIRNWMERMMDKGNTATSINRRLSALRSFYRFALKRRLVESDPAHAVVGPKRKKPLPMFLKEQEMEQLLNPLMWTDSYDDVLARTILIIFYETGIRLSELVSLDEKDVDFADVYNMIIENAPNTVKDPEIMVFMIIELVSSSCYSSILYSEPCDIGTLKPYLYQSIKHILHDHIDY